MVKRFIIYSLAIVVLATACSPAGGNKPGHEFMPDMVHNTGYEANYYDYYYYNRWGTEEEYKKYANPRLPVKGTIARNDASVSTPNGSVPYYFSNTEDERTRASKELIHNPYPITEKGLAIGKNLYSINCAICHGDKADGAGYLVRDDGGKYPVAPANFLQDTFYNSSNGRFYHAIMHGKNMMASYADKLSNKERWEVIHYIRFLQAKSKNLQYDANKNTLNSIDVPQAKWVSTLTMDVNAKNSEESTHDVKEHSIKKAESPKH